MPNRNHLSLVVFFFTLGIIAYLCFQSDESGYSRIDSIVQAEKELVNSTLHTLVVFDLDDTLLSPTEKMFHLVYRDINDFDHSSIPLVQLLRKNFQTLAIRKKEDPHYFNSAVSAIFLATIFVPTETRTIELIKALQQRSVKVIALTSSNTGKFYRIENMQQWRLKNLQQIGLDFSSSFVLPEITFTELTPEYGSYPVFNQGVLCAAVNKKGIVLAAFLDKIGYKPDKIIFFDDSKKQCQSVTQEMKKRGIPVQSFWYRAAYKEKIKLDPNIAQFQFDYWVAHEEFLSEKEAVEKIALTKTIPLSKSAPTV